MTLTQDPTEFYFHPHEFKIRSGAVFKEPACRKNGTGQDTI